MSNSIEFKILFWNVWCFPKSMTDGKLSDTKRARLISRHIGNYDLVLLNEAWTVGARDIFKKVYPYYYSDNNKHGKIYGNGLLILSKYPIHNPKTITYTHSAGWDWFSAKGAQYFQLQINNKNYDFFLTHMQAGYSELDQKARLYQSLQLSNFVNETLKGSSNKNVWLIGDFNMMPIAPIPDSGFRYKSVHCRDYDDAILRATSYNMILSETSMTDIQKGYDVYRILTKRTDNKTIVKYYDSNGLTDGNYLTIEFPY